MYVCRAEIPMKACEAYGKVSSETPQGTHHNDNIYEEGVYES